MVDYSENETIPLSSFYNVAGSRVFMMFSFILYHAANKFCGRYSNIAREMWVFVPILRSYIQSNISI